MYPECWLTLLLDFGILSDISFKCVIPYTYCNFIQLVLHRHRFADKQIVRVQETPDEIPEGGTPHTVSLLMHDKLVDAGKPGDRVEVRFHVIYC